MIRSHVTHSTRTTLAVLAGCGVFPFLQQPVSAQRSLGNAAQTAGVGIRLAGHIPNIVAKSRLLGTYVSAKPVKLIFTLPLRNQAQIPGLINEIYKPLSPLYGHYLTTQEFINQFGPLQADYDAVRKFAEASGLKVTGTHANRLLLDVEGTQAQVENLFKVKLLSYRSPKNETFYAPNTNPTLPTAIANRIGGLVGLDSSDIRHPHLLKSKFKRQGLPGATGHNGALAPADIKSFYDLTSVPLDGTGQTLALFELDGYYSDDIIHYEDAYSPFDDVKNSIHHHTPLQNVLLDGADGSVGGGGGEVTLDIELMIALAPRASKIIVYEAPQGGSLDTYNKIANDNLAKAISTSWGAGEDNLPATELQAENLIFQQMALQGQSIFDASGDNACYDDFPAQVLVVDDPAGQPYMCAVGGTTINRLAGGAMIPGNESVWMTEMAIPNTSPTIFSAFAGSGGGISSTWGIPDYQSGFLKPVDSDMTETLLSNARRNTPDVSLEADPATGYDIYFDGAWETDGGTSCAAPLWAAFTALVNQRRVANGSPLIGFLNPTIYAIGQSSRYTSDFNDINDYSTRGNLMSCNGYDPLSMPPNALLGFPATVGFDDATGWGTFNGANLLFDLAGRSASAVPPAPAFNTAPMNANAGAVASNGQINLYWSFVGGALSYNLYRSTKPGVETLYKTGLTTDTFIDTGLTNGVTYYYKLTAVNKAGSSPLSPEEFAVPALPANAHQLIGNPGFENGPNPSPWQVPCPLKATNSTFNAIDGNWEAYLCGTGTSHTDILAQTVTIPASIKTALLSFILVIRTAEQTSGVYDTCKIQIRSTTGTVLTTLATFSNLDAGGQFPSFSLTQYKGQTIQLYIIGTEDSSRATSFEFDDFALNIN